jgi:hypothetical protein
VTKPTEREGTIEDRKNTDRWLVIGLFMFLLIIVCVVTFVGARLIGEQQQAVDDIKATNDRIAQVEIKDRDVQRATAFRLCTRNKIDRAFAHSFSLNDLNVLRKLQKANGLPILDCEPNLEGKGARVLTPEQQRDFAERWLARELTPVELGICPTSRFGKIEAGHC